MLEDKLIAYFSKFRTLSVEQKDAIAESMDIRTYKKGELLLKEGQIAKSNYFVLKGCVRQYHLNSGNDETSNFFVEEDWILPSLGTGEDRSAFYNLECMEECVLVLGNEEKGDQLIAQFPEFNELAQIILEKEIIRQQSNLTNFMKNSPEERYLKLLSEQKDLINRVPQYHLASYIGVKPESLSRIRKRLAKK